MNQDVIKQNWFEDQPLLSQDTSSYQYDGGDMQNMDAEAMAAASAKSKPPPKIINYAFMDGLRGLGAFAVYLSHMKDQFYGEATQEQKDAGFDRFIPIWISETPLKLIYRGYFWVMLFFILSGFVLPMRFFKTGKTTCITGGTFRRYLRLMVPCFMIISLYYLLSKMGAMGQYTYVRIKDKTFGEFIIDSLFTTWIGGDDWSTATWTMSIELFATFFIYLLSQTAVQYRGRFWIYVAVIVFLMVPQQTDKHNWTEYKIAKMMNFIPVFFYGVILADLETFHQRPLDRIRDLHWGWKIPVNLALFVVAVSFGGYTKATSNKMLDCTAVPEEEVPYCYYWAVVSWNGIIPMEVCVHIGANALIILALTSDVAAWFLGSFIIQFLGRISFSLYLVHELFTEWLIVDTYYHFVGEGFSQNQAVLYAWLIYTPVLILVAWILTVLVDNPAKDFAYEVDVFARQQRPPPPKSDDQEEMDNWYTCMSFWKRSWKILLMVLWIFLVLLTTEIYLHTINSDNEQEKHENEANMGIIVTSQLKGR